MIATEDKLPSEETSLRYAGWRVVFACFLMALFLFGFALYGHGVFLAELQRLNGWPAALISGASTLSLLFANIFAVFTSELVSRLGSRRLVLLGLAALASSTTLLAFVTEPWQLYLAYFLMSFGWIGMGTIVSATIVSLWFVQRRGLAISLAFTGASFSGILVTPSLVYLVERLGFATAMLTGTVVMVAVLFPVTLAWIAPPSAAASAGPKQAVSPAVPGDVSRASLIRRLAFWTISIPFALALVAQIGFIVHQIAMLEPKIGRANAGFAVSVMTFMSIAGRFGLGAVIDRFDPRQVAAISIVSQAAALLIILNFDAIPIVLAACALFGFSVGNLITLPPLIMHREFSAASFVVVMGLSNAISGTVGSLGPAIMGVVQGWSGGYAAAIVLCVVLQLMAAVIVLWRESRAAEERG